MLVGEKCVRIWQTIIAAFYLKSGLYRPGSTKRPLPTDRVSIRKLRFDTVK